MNIIIIGGGGWQVTHFSWINPENLKHLWATFSHCWCYVCNTGVYTHIRQKWYSESVNELPCSYISPHSDNHVLQCFLHLHIYLQAGIAATLQHRAYIWAYIWVACHQNQQNMQIMAGKSKTVWVMLQEMYRNWEADKDNSVVKNVTHLRFIIFTH